MSLQKKVKNNNNKQTKPKTKHAFIKIETKTLNYFKCKFPSHLRPLEATVLGPLFL